MKNNTVTKTGFEIRTTKDYFLFKTLAGNRTIRPKHVEELKESFKERYLMSPILVNENYQIIDGQHRFTAAEDLDLPIYYIVCEGYGLEEVQALNTHSKNWVLKDFLNAYCDLGKSNYLKLRELHKRYSLVPLSYLVKRMGTRPPRPKSMSKLFQEGTWKFKAYEDAEARLDKIYDFKDLLPEIWNKTSFLNALYTVMISNNYDHKKMLDKVSRYPGMVVPGLSTSQYVLVLEDLFNYRSHLKVTLRYS